MRCLEFGLFMSMAGLRGSERVDGLRGWCTMRSIHCDACGSRGGSLNEKRRMTKGKIAPEVHIMRGIVLVIDVLKALSRRLVTVIKGPLHSHESLHG